MNRRNAIAPRPRVVVLSRRAELPAPLRDRVGIQASPVGSAYEAAAELLAAPAAAIIVDLALLTAADARLVKLARELEVEVLA
ncbi:MAG TPA: hypothetical protein DCX07_11950, partial [Phycisphaerales bacterium]|nr:hypothetical protein [Phycisphaerales bacterium]